MCHLFPSLRLSPGSQGYYFSVPTAVPRPECPEADLSGRCPCGCLRSPSLFILSWLWWPSRGPSHGCLALSLCVCVAAWTTSRCCSRLDAGEQVGVSRHLCAGSGCYPMWQATVSPLFPAGTSCGPGRRRVGFMLEVGAAVGSSTRTRVIAPSPGEESLCSALCRSQETGSLAHRWKASS